MRDCTPGVDFFLVGFITKTRPVNRLDGIAIEINDGGRKVTRSISLTRFTMDLSPCLQGGNEEFLDLGSSRGREGHMCRTGRHSGDLLCNPKVGGSVGWIFGSKANGVLLPTSEAVAQGLQGRKEERCRGGEVFDCQGN
jgi:hypothetical protein